MSKTIAFLLSDFQSGGTEWFALRLARGMKAKGVKPIFLVLQPCGDLVPLIDRDIKVVPLNSHGASFFQALQTLPHMIRFLKTQGPDALLGGLTGLNIVASFALFLAHTQTRFIAIEHMRLTQPTWGAWQQIKRFFKILFVRLSYMRADEVVAVSQAAKNDLIEVARVPAHKLRIIHNPVIPNNFEDLCQEFPPHPWLTTKKTPVVLGIGRLLANKDFACLITAFSKIANKTDARLLIFGEGPERTSLERLIQNYNLSSRIQLCGQIDNVFSALKAADLFVLPSRSEAFGNVIVEALACGCPVIATDSGGPREILEPNHLGSLVPPNDSDQLAEEMLYNLTNSPEGRDKRIAHGCSYDVETAVQKYLALVG